MVVKGAEKFTGKTKEAGEWLKKTEIASKGLLILIADKQKTMEKAFRNIEGVTVGQAKTTNIYEILKGKQIVVTSEALAELSKNYAA